MPAAPWYVTTINNGPLTNIVVMQAETMQTIAVVGVEGLADEEETINNAALIASAPTLLETMIEISERAISDEPLNKDDILELCSAAFEKLAAEAS